MKIDADSDPFPFRDKSEAPEETFKEEIGWYWAVLVPLILWSLFMVYLLVKFSKCFW